jgi:hypothetical protein
MLGRHAHIIAIVVSSVVQKVVALLEKVGSVVRPKCVRVERRTMDVMQTLDENISECWKIILP